MAREPAISQFPAVSENSKTCDIAETGWRFCFRMVLSTSS
jgi:hypothetical protein